MANEARDLVVVQSREVAASDTFMPVMDLTKALERHQAIAGFARRIMRSGEDYGIIPGSQKPTLFKAGAEKLVNFFGMEPDFKVMEEEKDWTGKDHGGEMFYYVRYRCTLHKNGKQIGMAEGSCNTWEAKYRYRWLTEEQVPMHLNKDLLVQQDGTKNHTEMDFAIEKGETTGKYGKPAEYWEQFREAMKAGTAKPGEKEIKGRKYKTFTISIADRLFRCPNPDMPDLVNTCCKMSQKRALTAAVLVATGASQFFTQDMEDNATPSDIDESPVENAVRQFRSASKAVKIDSFGVLRKELLKLTGEDLYYTKILKEEGQTEDPASFKTMALAVATFRKMWLEVERMSTPPDDDGAY